MDRTVRIFRVRDRNGVPFKVLEIERVETCGDRTRKFRLRRLETGEPGKFLDRDTFELNGTGERFVRIQRAPKATRTRDCNKAD